jgi:hypothetical protein
MYTGKCVLLHLAPFTIFVVSEKPFMAEIQTSIYLDDNSSFAISNSKVSSNTGFGVSFMT